MEENVIVNLTLQRYKLTITVNLKDFSREIYLQTSKLCIK